jgi:DNA-binding NtrC family response regulator
MARILISESHDEVRRLLERMVTRLGHEAIVFRVTVPQQPTYADVLVVEPATPVGAVHAQAMSMVDPSLPIICASVIAPPPELAQLGVLFAASLVKPFTLEQLGAAIEEALLPGSAHQGYRRRQDLGNRAA